MWIVPRLVTGSVFGITRICTEELPCPEGGTKSVSQVTSVLAFHAHSGCAVIETDVVPPAAATGVSARDAETAHLAAEGVVELSELDVQPTIADSAASDSAAITRPIVRVIRLGECL